jgi:zinc protease
VPGKSGFAHLFEHMMFQGSQHTGPDAHFSVLRGIGAQGVNGTTSTDRTNYYQTVPSHQVETALWLESDRMGYLLPALTQEMLDNQREVVRNERRQNYENVAYSEERFAVARALYPEGHPYRHLTIGLHDDIERATLDDVRGFFHRWYVPANATLLVAGDIDVPATKAMIEKWFGTFPPSVRPTAKVPPPPVLRQKVRETFVDSRATLTRVRYVWPSPPLFAPGDAELDIIADVLDSATGRLRRTLVVDRALARTVSAIQQSRRFSSEFHVVVDLQVGASVSEVEASIRREISTLSSRPLAARELTQSVAGWSLSFVRGLEHVSGRAGSLQLYNLHGREPDAHGWDLQRYRQATTTKVQSVAREFLTENRVEIVTMAGGGN